MWDLVRILDSYWGAQCRYLPGRMIFGNFVRPITIPVPFQFATFVESRESRDEEEPGKNVKDFFKNGAAFPIKKVNLGRSITYAETISDAKSHKTLLALSGTDNFVRTPVGNGLRIRSARILRV